MDQILVNLFSVSWREHETGFSRFHTNPTSENTFLREQNSAETVTL